MWPARLLVLVFAVLLAAPNHKPSTVPDAIGKIRAEWAKDLHDKQLGRIVMLYALDAAFLTPNGERITGPDAIRELCKSVMATFTSDLTFHSITTEHSGDLAYDSGEYHETLAKLSDGSSSEGKGNYLMVFRRQRDGNWLIVQQVWTESVAAHH